MADENEFVKWVTNTLPESTKGGPGSGFYGHVGRPGQVGGSRVGRAGRPDAMTGEVRMGLGQLMQKIDQDGGFTYRPTSGFKTVGDVGYSVSLPGHEKAIPKSKLTKQDIMDYWLENREVVRNNPRAHFGAWWDQENDVVTLDVSVIIKDEAEARRVGIQNKQAAIFHLEKGELIWLHADEGRLEAVAAETKEVENMAKGKGTKPVVRIQANGHAKTPEAEWQELVALGKGLGLDFTEEDHKDFLERLEKADKKPGKPSGG